MSSTLPDTPRSPIVDRSGRFFIVVIVVIMALLLAVSGCRSVPEITEIDPDLSPDELFQMAQKAFADEDNYKAAIVYYQAFLDRFPGNISRGVEAEYEMAFIYYKQGKYEESKARFEALIERYEQEGAEVLPAWPRILAEKVLQSIEEKTTRRFPRRRRSDETDEADETGSETDEDSAGTPSEEPS
jgi:tetratricopeptide (TPR) repeat protein